MKNKWLILMVIGLLFIIGFRNRWIFDYKFEPKYWENFYYHSQWNIPNSSRVIGDEGLYQYAGWRYANGDNPFDINYMVPPLGKWLYGLSARYFQNPYITSIVVYLISFVFFILIAKIIFKKKPGFSLAILLFVTNPMLIAQIRATMLDIVQMLFLLGQMFFLFIINEKNKKWTILVAGIFLGMVSGVKIALFLPVIGLIDLWYLAKKWGTKTWFVFAIGVVVGYVLSYFCYFSQHPNPIPWFRLHEKVWDFWKNGSGIAANPIWTLRYIFLNQFLGWWEGAKLIISREWTPIMPLGLGLAVFCLAKIRKNIRNNLELTYLSLISVLWFGICLMVNFWPRYLVPIVPILCLISALYFGKTKWLSAGMVIVSLIFMIPALYNSPEETGKFMCENIAKNAYRESYQLLTPEISSQVDEERWILENREITETVGVESSVCKIEIGNWKLGQKVVEAKAVIVFFTRSGEKRYDQMIKFVDIKGEWKVDWRWDNKEIENLKQKKLSENGNEWRYIWVVPEQIENWPETVKMIEGATEMDATQVWKTLQKVVPDKYPTTVGWIKENISVDEYNNLIVDKAVRIEKRKNSMIKNIWNITEKSSEIRWLEVK